MIMFNLAFDQWWALLAKKFASLTGNTLTKKFASLMLNCEAVEEISGS